MIGWRDWKVNLRAVSQELSALSSKPTGEESHYVLGRISAPLRPDDARLTTRKMTGGTTERNEENEENEISGPLRPDDARLTRRTNKEEADD